MAKRSPGSFYEAEHLGGDTDMVALIAAIVREENRRWPPDEGPHHSHAPDHGQDILDDLGGAPIRLTPPSGG